MWDMQQGKLRQEELLRQAENHRRRLQMRPRPSHNYLMIARTRLGQVLRQRLVRRDADPG